MAAVTKIDSNVSGLRLAEESSIGVLPASPTWRQREPNGYGDFGGQTTNVARNFINDGRQRQKGVLTDLDVTAGWQEDWTYGNFQDVGQGYFFADMRRKAEANEHTTVLITDVNGSTEQITLDSRSAVSAVVAAGGTGYVVGDVVTVSGGTFTTAATFTVTGVTGGVVDTVALAEEGRYSTTPGNPAATTGGTGTGLTLTVTYGNEITFQVGDLVWIQGLGDTANNGLKRVTAVSNNVLTVAEDLVTDASPAATATLVTVGFQGTAGDIDVSSPGGQFPTLTSTSLDFTTLGLIPGEWIRIGGDTASLRFATAANNGFARIRSIAATVLTLDKTQATMVTEASTTETVQLFFGRVLKNETGTSIKRRTYSMERTLGAPDDALPAQVQAEYNDGAVPNTVTFQYNTADKITMEMGWLPINNVQIDGPTALRAGTRPTLVSEDAFNTSNDFARLKMNVVSDTDSNPSALFGYLQEFTLTINNNATPNKAISVFGAFEVTAGQFTVGGNARAYFSTVAGVSSVRNNSDVTMDWTIVNGSAGAKQGVVVDVPLITLGDARLQVELDQPILLPLNTEAAADRTFNHTLLMTFFDYLPDAADPSP